MWTHGKWGGEWQFKSLVTENLSAEEEIRIIQEWVDHMRLVRDNLNPQNGIPRIFHWSHAEPTVLDKAYNSAKARHQEHADWPELGWYDFLTKVMREEPVVVRGALGFGLKAVANALHSHGLIETDWGAGEHVGIVAPVETQVLVYRVLLSVPFRDPHYIPSSHYRLST